MRRKSDTEHAGHGTSGRQVDDASARARAPWPDSEAREQMSRAESEREAGKHAKNPDWNKRW